MTRITHNVGKDRLSAILAIRNRHFIAFDVLTFLLVPALALSLRLDTLNWWSRCCCAFGLFAVVAMVVKVSIFYWLGLYRRYWRYAGVNDLILVPIAVSLSTLVLTVLFATIHAPLQRYGLAMYRSVPVIDGILTGLTVGGSRFGLRMLYHRHHRRRDVTGGRRVLVVGAGEAGTLVIHEVWANPQLGMEPVAFVDDDPLKVGTQVQGLPVIGTCARIPEVVEPYGIQRIVVAIPSASLPRRQEILALCESTGVSTYSLPGVYELLAGHKTVSRLPQVDVSRLLHRVPVKVDWAEVDAALNGATVLVTGAGGSIGSELCRQIARSKVAEIILLGHGENSIFEIGLDLRLSFPDLIIHQVIADIRDWQRINWVIKEYRPDTIFHAAAHKHVSFMEEYVEEAVTNNVLGTLNVLRAAELYDVEHFVLISTDKAVNPTSIMGATKRLAELLVMAYAQRSGRAYTGVRFGNVLGSRGSVIPVFQQQIAAGGPLTVTHPDMYRYFMTIPEAVQLVLQAFQLGRGGEIFVLDMGEPVRILDLAADLIRLSGLEPGRDIDIVYTGVRPGEKLNEELFSELEKCRRTKHPKILAAADGSAIEAEVLELLVMELIDLTRQTAGHDANERMKVLLPEVCRCIDGYQSTSRRLLPKPIIALEASPAIRRCALATSGSSS